jgi:oligopeptide transport system ATP-binding protein
VRELLQMVGLRGVHADYHPHEFSGGQRQRIGIARALALESHFLVLDEPTSSLDVSVQAQILNLLQDLKAQLGLTYLLISHNLGVVEYMADNIAVMYLGQIVEYGPTEQLMSNPRHPYTQALISAVLRPEAGRQQERIVLEGDPPNPANPPPGCRFHTRCPYADALSREKQPALDEIGPGHLAACHHLDRIPSLSVGEGPR